MKGGADVDLSLALEKGKSLRERSELFVDTQFWGIRKESREKDTARQSLVCYWVREGVLARGSFLIYVECRLMNANEKQSFATEGAGLRYVVSCLSTLAELPVLTA